MDQSSAIMASWHANAGNWIATIDNKEIESRQLVTNEAIQNAILDHRPNSILDIGCGEGWLCRALRSHGIDAFGVDGVEALIQNAIEKDGAHYAVASFRALADGALDKKEKFEAAVINFALLDELDTVILLKNVHRLVQKNGLLFIQTLHPFAMAAQQDYISGWKEGSWNGLKRNFDQPYQWYFRTLEDWLKLFAAAGLTIMEIREPMHPVSKQPASAIFILSV